MQKCRLCGSENTSAYLALSGDYQIYYCENCLNAFTSPAPALIKYEEEDFHEQFNFSDINDLPQQWKSGLKKQLSLIKTYIPANANILEIGCGQGLFLAYLKANGYNVYGVEPSISASETARKKGLNVITGYYPDQRLDHLNFDLIIMSQVLEHVPEPLELLKQIGKNNNSYLLLIQTNLKGFVPMKQKKDWYGWVPDQHFWHFTAKGLNNICKDLDFKTLKTEYSSLEHNNYWLSKLTEWLPHTGDQIHSMIKL